MLLAGVEPANAMSEPWPLSDDEAAELMDKMVRIQRGHRMTPYLWRVSNPRPTPTPGKTGESASMTESAALTAELQEPTHPRSER